MSADKQFEKLKNEIYDRLYQILPEIASLFGLHNPYDRLFSNGDLTPDLEIEQTIDEAVQRMKDTIDFNALNDSNKIDWEVLERLQEFWKFILHEQRQNVLNPDGFELIGMSFFLMISKEYAPLEERMTAMVSRLKEIPRYLEEFRTRFEKSKPVKLWTEIALETAQTMPGLIQFIAVLGKGQISEKLQASLEGTVTALETPIKEHIAWLQQLQANTIENWAIGKKKFEKLIGLRDLGMTSEEILQFGIKSLKDLKKERTEIATQIDPDKTIEEIMALIEADAPKTYEEALQATKTAMEEAKQFIIDQDLASPYEEDKLIVEETPLYMAPLIPFAALIPPSRFDDPKIGIYVVTRPKDIANLSKHLNYPSIRNTAVHEAYPGHFLQTGVSLRGSLLQGYAGTGTSYGAETVEGWAHYCEQMMMEKGFVTGLEAKMVQLTGAIWRAVRIIVDVKLSRGEMTFDEAVDMLIKETGMTKEGAVAEVRRYTLTPGYPLSYLLGKHLILKLRDEIMQKMGDQYSDKFFHDTIAANGYLPVSLLRKVFDQKIAKLES
ncbi:MAG: DUF885 domain-containing protein [Candidatus Hermodarchaeota archaeon]|nr:DUF885 domain-containing protein [Candidatus Hermodarchaeota archaeon]